MTKLILLVEGNSFREEFPSNSPQKPLNDFSIRGDKSPVQKNYEQTSKGRLKRTVLYKNSSISRKKHEHLFLHGNPTVLLDFWADLYYN